MHKSYSLDLLWCVLLTLPAAASAPHLHTLPFPRLSHQQPRSLDNPTPFITRIMMTPTTDDQDPHGESHPQKRKRMRLSLGDKIEVARALRNGTKIQEVAHRFRISRRSACTIKSYADSLLDEENTATLSLTAKTIRNPRLPHLEARMLQFVEIARCARMPLTQQLLKKHARITKDKLLKTKIDPLSLKTLKAFVASNPWTHKFVHRHALRTVSPHAVPASSDPDTTSQHESQFQQRLCEFELDCIYKVDEPGLFYKLLPRHQYSLSGQQEKSLKRVDAMDANDRVSAYVCTNGDASDKVPISIIATLKTPQCFRLAHSPIPYFHQVNAWSDGETFRAWFFNVFVPHVRTKTTKKVLLLVDNCAPQVDNIIDDVGQITLLTLPPNSSALHLPTDLSISTAWKARYKCLMLREIIGDVPTRRTRRIQGRMLKKSMRGIAEGCDPHLLDVAEMAQQSWDSVSKMTIARCWEKASIVASNHPDAVNTTMQVQEESSMQEMVQEVTDMMTKTRENLLMGDPLQEVFSQEMGAEEIERWFDVELDPDVVEAMVNDALEKADSAEKAGEDDDEDEPDKDSSDSDADERVPSMLPPVLQLQGMFAELETLAFDFNLPDVGTNLRRAKRLLFDAAIDSVNGNRSQ